LTHNPRGTALVGVAVALGGLGAGLVWVSANHPASPPRPPAAVSTPTAGAVAATSTPHRHRSTSPTPKPVRRGVPDRLHGLILPASEPLAVRIRRLGVQSRLVRLGLDSAGEMQVPSDPSLAGWYTRGPAPGALGPAVIAGHVTWNLQPAVFYRLSELREGDRVQVMRKDHQTAVFAVVNVVRYPKTRFPTGHVFGALNYAGLRLITCGGTYDATYHRYLDNVVVFARLVSVHPTTT
jgi:Sortase domain